MPNPLDKLNPSIEPSDLPKRPPRAALPNHLKQDFFAEYATMDKVLSLGAALLSGYTSRGQAWSSRKRFYWARAKHRFSHQDLPEAAKYDGIFITIESYENEGETYWSVKFQVSHPTLLTLDGIEIS